MIRWSADERAALEAERAELQERVRYLDVLLSGSQPDVVDETVRMLHIPGSVPRRGRPGVPAPTPRAAGTAVDELDPADSVTGDESGSVEDDDAIGGDR